MSLVASLPTLPRKRVADEIGVLPPGRVVKGPVWFRKAEEQDCEQGIVCVPSLGPLSTLTFVY